VLLRPATKADGPGFYALLLRLGIASLPRQDVFVAGYDRDFAASFAICSRSDGEVRGYASLFELDPAGHVQVGVCTDPTAGEPGLGAEAALLTINFAFSMWNIRKVYIRTTAASISRFGGTTAAIARKEAVLTEHMFFQGQLWDVHIFAIYRQDWIGAGKQIVERLAGRPDHQAHNQTLFLGERIPELRRS
jgi:RimJ/RimL family protein N-acetyltransferase